MKKTLKNGQSVHFRTASNKDVQGIIDLYIEVYNGKYTLPEVADPEVIAIKTENPNYFWLVAEIDNKIVGSVIFAIDPVNKFGKSYAAAVSGSLRGQDIMKTMVGHGLEVLTKKTRTCDVIYATTRTVSFAPQVVLEHLGFHPMGIFPNVRKVEAFETHGLEVYFREDCFDIRCKTPRLVPETKDFYMIVKNILNLEEPEIVDLEMEDPRKMGKCIEFIINEDIDEVRSKFDEFQTKDLMDKMFFPLIEPNLLFQTKDGTADIFVNFNKLDGNGVVLAYRHTGDNLRHMLMWFCEAASNSGMRYIEMLVNAYRPEMQRILLDAKFLPCAYFPAMRMTPEGTREDYLTFSRSFEKLDFMDMNLVDTNRKFLDAFMKSWYSSLVRCQPDFDEEWNFD